MESFSRNAKIVLCMRNKFYLFKAKQGALRTKRMRRLKLLSRHPVAVPVATFCVLLLVSIGGFVALNHNKVRASNAFIVIISRDHTQQTIPTREPTVGALLSELHIRIRTGDVVEPNLTTQIQQDDFRINIYRAVPVEIVDGSQKTFTTSAATTPRSIAAQAGSTVYPEDVLAVRPTTNFLTEDAIGERVVINRSTPVKLNLYGNEIATRTHATTVGALLREKHITLAKGDTVAPKTDVILQPGQQVLIAHRGTKLAVKTEKIPMPIKRINDANLAFGTSAVRQKGNPGTKATTYKILLKNGKEVGRQVVQTVIVEQPVQEIVVVGTSLSGIKGDMSLAGISASDYNYADYIISHESGWCPTKWQGEYGGCPVYHGTPGGGVGYGLGQATPGSKMAAYGSDWATNPITQLKWANSYAHSRWGSWYAAYQNWRAYSNW